MEAGGRQQPSEQAGTGLLKKAFPRPYHAYTDTSGSKMQHSFRKFCHLLSLPGNYFKNLTVNLSYLCTESVGAVAAGSSRPASSPSELFSPLYCPTLPQLLQKAL